MPTRQIPRRRRRPRGVAQQRRHAVTTNPERTSTRKFIYQVRVSLNNAVGTNTVHESYQRFNALSIQGFSTVAQTYDQYRVKRVRCYLQNSLPQRDPSASAIFDNIARLPRNANPSVNVMTAVDHTPGLVAGPNIYAYNNVQFRVPDNDFSTKIADYVPRLNLASTTDQLVRPTNNYVACTSTTIDWTGFQLYIVNTGGNLTNSIWQNPLFQQTYLLRYEIDIEFKQPTYTTSPPLVAVEERAQELLQSYLQTQAHPVPDDQAATQLTVTEQEEPPSPRSLNSY